MTKSPGYVALSLALVTLAGLACSPGPAAPTPKPAEPAAKAVQPAAKPAEPAAKPAPTAAAPAAKPTVDAAAAAWEQTVAAAKREGKVSVIGPQGADTQAAMTEGFERKYPEIRVDLNGLPGNQVAPKLIQEQAAGQHFIDLAVTGSTTVIAGLLPARAVEPIPPYLVGPATTDLSKWWQGKLHFADEAKIHDLVFGALVLPPFVHNPDRVSTSDFKSYYDLLDPRWRGQIVTGDPRVAGSMLAIATFWYTTDALGKDFIQRFYSQDVLVLRDDRQILELIARGERPIGVGPGATVTLELMRRGLPLRYGDFLREGAFLTAGNSTVAVAARPPNPNAAKVYLDYLLSQEGQTEWSKGLGFPTFRRDVPTDHLLPALVPQEGVSYQENHNEYYVNLRDEVVGYLRSVIGS